MARDSSLYLRKAVVAFLKAEPTVGGAMSARMYGPKPPAKTAWPFGRYGVPTVTPFRAVGLDGSRHALSLHFFAKGEDETQATELAAAACRALEGVVLPLSGPYPAKARFTWTGTIPMQDSDEANAWHVVAQMEAKVSA